MSKLLYNGVELPAVPAHDADATVEVISAVLPAALSMYAQSPYILVIGKGTLWQSGKCYVRGVSAVYRLSGDAWVWHYGSGTVSTQDIVAANYFEAIWTNTDIPTADGAGIYLAASAPVDPNAPDEPEPEEPPVEPNVDVAAIYRRGWMDGFLSGINIRGLLRRRKVEEPQPVTAYLYGTPSPTIVTYNGVELPELPEWDKETYPYAYINVNTSTGATVLCFFDRAAEYKTINLTSGTKAITNVIYYAGETATRGACSLSGDTWGEITITTMDRSDWATDGYFTLSNPIWCNTDIPNIDNNTTYLAASEPVRTQVGGNLYLADVDEWRMYKGVVLPPLPAEVLSKNYIQIRYLWNGSGYNLAYLEAGLSYSFNTNLWDGTTVVQVPVGAVEYKISWNDGEEIPTHWGEPKTIGNAFNTGLDQITWANVDLYTVAGELYRATSEPLEVASLEPVYRFDFDQPFPALPADIDEQGQYHFIGRVYHERSEPILLATSVKPIWKGSYYGFSSETLYSQYRLKNGAWEFETGGKTTALTWRVIEWSNFNVLDSSGAVYLAASDYPANYKMEFPIYETRGWNDMGIDVLAMIKKATPKVINLTEYSNDGLSLNLMVLSLFGAGGGELSLPNVNNFWEDVSTEQALRFVIDGTEGNMPFKVQIDGMTSVINTEADSANSWFGQAVQIAVRFRMVNPSMDINHDIAIVFLREGNGNTGIVLTMTPVA